MGIIHLPVYIMALTLVLGVVLTVFKIKHINTSKPFILFSLITSWFLCLTLFINVINNGSYEYNFGKWREEIGIQFSIDSFSSFMALLIATLICLATIYSFKTLAHEIEKKQILRYYGLIFILMFSMLGITFSNDLFNMYVFMEILSIVSCAIISIKNTKETYVASFRYMIFSTIGSVCILLGIAFLYMVIGYLNINMIRENILLAWDAYPLNIIISLGLIVTGFFIKTALFPLHIWLPDAHSSAPSSSSALLSALVLKVYIFSGLKFFLKAIDPSIVSEMKLSFLFTLLALAGIIAGSVFALFQKDLKRLLSYSTIAHIGYIFLGIALFTERGLSASLFHIVSHSLMKCALFLSVGAIIYKTGKRYTGQLNGIGYEMPITMLVFSISALGMIGIPGVNGFISKLYLSLALLEENQVLSVVVLMFASFMSLFYYIPIISAAYLKKNREHENIMAMDKLHPAIIIPMVLLAVACIITGLFPQLLMNVIEKTIVAY